MGGCGARDGANLGCPIRRDLEAVGDFSVFDLSSVEEPGSSEDITIYWGFGLDGVISLTVPEKGNGCSEHTSLASIATPRSKAQNSWAPKSREPCNILAWVRKSPLDRKTSAFDIIDS
jgi:hypothetical protein